MSNAAKLLEVQKNLIPINSPVPNRRILVVDDEPEIAKGIEQILSPKSENVVKFQSSRRKQNETKENINEFEVVVVHSPKDALLEIRNSIAQNNPFAMGFFDVMLGADIDGIDLVKEIFTLDTHLYAVFVTAYHDRSVDSIGTFLGEESRERWDYVNKPFSEGEILQKARNVTSLWDLNRLKEWQAERLDVAHQLLLKSEKHNAVAAIGRSVAHEFGNLLTHIIGHAEIAQDLENLDEIKKSLDIILKAGQTAASVLKNFRNINGPEGNIKEFRIENLQNILDEALELMEFRFRRHNIEVIKNDWNKISAEVDKNSVIQVLANIFINAIHAMPSGGKIFISLKEEDSKACLSVRDTGSGIPIDLVDKVEEPLFTTKGSEGSGLGLAICKEIIEIDHQGEFSISNYIDGGAIVGFSFPQIRES